MLIYLVGVGLFGVMAYMVIVIVLMQTDKWWYGDDKNADE